MPASNREENPAERNDPLDEFKLDLAEACKFKVQHGAGVEALVAQFKALYKRAKHLEAPWPQIAAYRLAHVTMRGAKTPSDFQKAEELFAKASRLNRSKYNALGPMPQIYRIAALQRLADARGVGSETVRQCRAEIARLFQSLTNDDLGYASLVKSPKREASIQGAVYNYLELISYLTGTEYRPLAGMRSPFGDLMLADDWLILTSAVNLGPGTDLRYSHGLAKTELEARLATHKVDLLFELGDPSIVKEGYVWVPGRERVSIPLREILLLKKYCQSPHATGEELERSIIFDRDGRATRLPAVTYELKKKLGTYGEIEGKQAILKARGSEPARLNPAIRVLGMVHYRAADASGLPVREYNFQEGRI